MNDEIGRHRPARHEPVSGDVRELLFVTCATKDRKPLLARHEIHDILVQSWTTADAWQIGRYVIMPDHIHFFCGRGPGDERSLENWMRYWKSLATKSWPNPGEKPIWQRGHWDTRLRRGENYFEKWEYVRNNPVRAGLWNSPDDWPFQGELNILDW